MNAVSQPLTRCSVCRYDLTGLPNTHRCPECGFAYDDSMTVWWVPVAPLGTDVPLVLPFVWLTWKRRWPVHLEIARRHHQAGLPGGAVEDAAAAGPGGVCST